MKLTIRHANSGDISVLRRLLSQLSGHTPSSEQVENRLALVAYSPTDSLYVCEQGGAVVGALGFRIRENLEEVSRYAEISLLVVLVRTRWTGSTRGKATTGAQDTAVLSPPPKKSRRRPGGSRLLDP